MRKKLEAQEEGGEKDARGNDNRRSRNDIYQWRIDNTEDTRCLHVMLIIL